ncbi:MAG: HEAT repeat domain-containing protein [bacterium]|nr:HEAT repeat domain-containing protein [bacterium]
MNNREFPYSHLEHLGRDFASRGVVVLAPEDLGLPTAVHGQIYEQEKRAVQAKKPVTCALIPTVLDVINAPGVVAACNQLVGENWAIVPFTHNASFASGARDQAWHKDDNGPYNSRKQRHHQAVQIEMLYYPQAVLDDMGPTATAPYSHYWTFNHEENQDNFAGADHLDFDYQLTGMEREPVSGPDSSYTEQDILQRNTAHDVRMRDAVTDLQWPLVQQLETAPLRAGSVVLYSHNTFHRGNHRRDDWRTWADSPRFMWRFWIYRTTEPDAGNGRQEAPSDVDWNRLGTDPMTGADLATATDDVTVVWRHHHHWMQTGQVPPPRAEAVSLSTTAREAEAQRLLAQLQHRHDAAEPARIGAAYKLASIGDTAVAVRHLEQGLYSDRESVRRAATYGLVAVGTDATETLLKAAASPIRWVRKAGIYGLGDASQLTEAVLRAVAACLQDDPSVYVRSVAAGSLGCLGRRAVGTGVGRDLLPQCLDALVQSLGREVNRVAMDRAQKRSIKYVRPTDDCDVCEGGGVDFGLERFQPVRSAVRENVLWSIVILCSHGATIVGAALAPTIQALRDVVRNDDNVICVGFAMDALNRLAHLRPAEEMLLPAISDLQADMPEILASSPIQCWEALVRGDGTCRPTDA